MDKPAQATIFGLAGHSLTDAERDFFRAVNPWGFILFARNIDTADRLRQLTYELHELTGRDVLPILIDQEGGRVARLKPPMVRLYPAAEIYGRIYQDAPEQAMRAAFLGSYLIGRDLRDLGITIDCLPCLDLSRPETSDVIGDRAYGSLPQQIAELGGAAGEGLMAAGVLPVIKHLPGHGRGSVDSHFELPVVTASPAELAEDFIPFQACRDFLLGMTGHLKFEQLDAEFVSTQSPYIIQHIIRRQIGFDGLLMTDDISMQALSGTIAERAERSLKAGCDIILHCNGDMAEMVELADIAALSGDAAKRAEAVTAQLSGLHVEKMDNALAAWQEIVAPHFPKAPDAV
jgi:beta-N-acetylhexosaminidase